MKNLIIILDGLGYDQITYFSPGHLAKWMEELGSMPLDTLLAYSSGIYTALYTGKYPDDNNFWTEFVRRAQPLPVWTSFFRLVPGKSLPRKLAYVAGRAARILDKESQDNFAPPFIQEWFDRIPVHYDRLPPIAIKSSELVPTLFQNAGKSLRYLQCEQLSPEVINTCVQVASECHTLVLCLAETDHMGHAFGPMSSAFGTALLDLDRRLAVMLERLRAVEPGLQFFVFSDHGMTPVTEKFDVWNFLENNGFRLGKDYLAFINSTIVSLWFEKNNRDPINVLLDRSGYGKMISNSERSKYHLSFGGREYGDDLFVAREGVEFIPNFLSLAWKPNLGMHGYLPECSSTRAFFIGSKQVGFRPTDVVSLHRMFIELISR